MLWAGNINKHLSRCFYRSTLPPVVGEWVAPPPARCYEHPGGAARVLVGSAGVTDRICRYVDVCDGEMSKRETKNERAFET